MRKIFIKYNPYRLETTIKIDEEIPKKNSKLNFGNKRLQEWIDKLPDLLVEECNSRSFDLVFKGTLLDFEDVQVMKEEAEKKGININLQYRKAKEVSEKEKAIKKIFNKIQNGPFAELKQPDLIQSFENAYNDEFEVSVVATMSAGKSTLINALLGQKLMPAKHEACTAIVTKIKDNDKDQFSAKVYDKNDKLIQTNNPLTDEIMKNLNENTNVKEIHAEGNIPFITSDEMSLVLVDTPGPNNARNLAHKEATFRMLSESAKTLVLYVLNATQLGVNDDSELLSNIAETMNKGGKQSRDRFIFVVNKLDDFRDDEDCIESTLENVKDYLQKKGIDDPVIFPASALTALKVRTLLNQPDLDDKDFNVRQAKMNLERFNFVESMHFENYASLTPSMKNEIKEKLDKAIKNNDMNTQGLIHSGIIPIEIAIKTYVKKYAKTAKIKNIYETFATKLSSANSMEKLKQEIMERKGKKKEIEAQIKRLEDKINNGEDAMHFKEEIEKIDLTTELNQSIQAIIKKAQDEIINKPEFVSIKTNSKLEKSAIDYSINEFNKFIGKLQFDVMMKLEDIINNTAQNKAKELLNQYIKKLAQLNDEISQTGIDISPVKIMRGNVDINVNSVIEKALKKEEIEVGKEWIENKDKKWYKPWTWWQEKGYFKSITETHEYIDGQEFVDNYFAPVQEELYKNGDIAMAYGKQQIKLIKDEFMKKFDELDEILKKKLDELKVFTSENQDNEYNLRESQYRKKWLERIEQEMNAILDI